MFVIYKAQTPAQTLPDVYKITQPVSFKDINLNGQLKLCTEYKMESWLILDSWLDSVHFDYSGKWFHRTSCGHSASASHQNQRAHRFTYGGRFLCWGLRCSFTVLLSHQRWLQLAPTICVLGGFYKVALCVRLCNEPV